MEFVKLLYCSFIGVIGPYFWFLSFLYKYKDMISAALLHFKNANYFLIKFINRYYEIEFL